MGSGWSHHGGHGNDDTRKKRGETEEEYKRRRQQLAKQAGILAPPVFLHPQESSSLSLSTLAQLAQSQHPPNLIEHLWTTDFGSRLLTEYVTPGFSLQLPTSVDASSSSLPNQKNNHLLIHLQPATTISSSSILLAQHQFGPLQVQLNVPAATTTTSYTTGSSSSATTPQAGPLLQLSAAQYPYFSLHAGIPLQEDDDDGGWIETKFKARTTSGFDVVASAWMGIMQQDVFVERTVHLQCGIDHQEALLAVQTKLPLDFSSSSSLQLFPPPMEYFMSIDLNHRRQDADAKMNHASDDAAATTSSPNNPLWLSLKHQSHNRSNHSSHSRNSSDKTCWALNLSQLVHFDRINLNPVDERAPQIRQSCAWAIQMEKTIQQQQSQQKHENSSITWSAAASMQWNRHLGTKVVWQDAAQALTVAAVLRQWEEPRITLSLMHQWSRNHHHARGWSVGLEVQPLSSSSSSTSKTGQQRQGPPTQILLPD